MYEAALADDANANIENTANAVVDIRFFIMFLLP
jgi:hypothetical protein